jgi:outer membrane protein insertion porin family
VWQGQQVLRSWAGPPITVLAVMLGLTMPSSGAETPAPRVVAIDIEGLKRVEPAPVRRLLSSREGDRLNPDKVREDIRALNDLGYFQDIRVYSKAVAAGEIRLVFAVIEKPSVRKVEVEGNDDVSDDDLKEVVDIRPFTILDASKVQENVNKVKAVYEEKGFFLTEVSSRIEPLNDEEVKVVIQVQENAKVEVRRVRFVGNQNIPDDDLKGAMQTREGGLLSFLDGSGTYRKDAFQVDLLRISAQYYDNGYVNVKIDTPDVEISPDRNFIYITIRIEEGDQFFAGKMAFSGDELDTQDPLAGLVEMEEGDVFNRTMLNQDLIRIKTAFEDEGYAYANITPVTAIHGDTKRIDITFDAEKGRRVYYERINFKGNTKTRDKVIRRELRIYEGDLTSASLRELSKRRLEALGYFESVDFKTRRGSTDELQILEIEVKEKSTGTFQVGAGFSSAENFIATAQVSQENFLGQGQSISLSAQISSLRQLFQVRFTEPYFLDTQWTFSLNGFNTETQFRSFIRASTGGDITLGHPLTDELRLFLTYSLEFTRSRPDNVVFTQPAFAALNTSGRISSLGTTLTYDTRNNRLFPTSGMFHSGSAELSATFFGASETRTFQRFRLTSRYYQQLFWEVIAKGSLQVGYINSTSPLGLSPAEKFVLGGINSLRGFLPFSVGPERRATRNDRGVNAYDPYSDSFVFVEGGNKEILLNLEIEFPIFKAVNIRGVVFLDAGNAYAEEENFFYIGDKARASQREQDVFDPLTLPLGLFWSVGFGFRWLSPIGPLRFEWGIPLTPRPTDGKGPLFQFSIGNSF